MNDEINSKLLSGYSSPKPTELAYINSTYERKQALRDSNNSTRNLPESTERKVSRRVLDASGRMVLCLSDTLLVGRKTGDILKGCVPWHFCHIVAQRYVLVIG